MKKDCFNFTVNGCQSFPLFLIILIFFYFPFFVVLVIDILCIILLHVVTLNGNHV